MSAEFDSPVRDYASRTLVTVRAETPLPDVQALFDAHDISAVVVVDPAGALAGIFTTTDMLRIARIEMLAPGVLARVWPPPHEVGPAMRAKVVTCDDGETLRQAAAKMVAHRIHRVVVTRGGAPVGVLTTRDAMRAILLARVTEPLGRVMTTSVQTVDVGDSIDLAVERLTEANVHGLVVVDGAWPVGVFTQREAIQARALPASFRRTPVEQVMSYETICHDVSTPLHRIAGQAIQMNVRRVLAVESRRLAGIATGFDLVRYMCL